MDEEIQKPEPKISDVEIILIGIFYLGLDAIDFIPAAGDITDVIAAPMGFYYWMKGLNGTAFLASEAIEAIPGAQEIPFVRTITWGINIWLDRHPKLEAAFATVEAIGGGVEALEGGEVGAEAVGGEGISERGIAAETAGSGAAIGETGEAELKTEAAESSRPSEQSTERDINDNTRESEREATQQPTGNPEGQEMEEVPEEAAEDARQREKDKEYEEIMETGAEKEPIQQAEEELFSEKGPQESESTRRLRERFQNAQQARQQTQEDGDAKLPRAA